ncbi:MAG: iron-containing alcohol dehydrogenase [Clostridiales bacterium]|nr:iron-containing alcohol dehydrogenase [Clostridiales bacterium]
MLDFIYNTPTKVFFGEGKEKCVGEIIKEYGYKKVMIQFGKSSAVKSGLLKVVTDSLDECGIEYVTFGGVEPNPKLNKVYEAIKIAKSERVDFILAIGGGSVIDSCKMTALGVKNDDDVWNFSIGKNKPVSALPVGCILTIAAAGSEMSSSAVLTNTENNMKKGCTSELNRCKFAILNPALTYSVSKYQTACGVVDIMSHTIERYFSVCPPTLLTDEIAEGLLRSVIESGSAAIDNPSNYDARANIMWASSLSHNGLTGCGREGYLAVHQLEHALSGLFDNVPHGAGLAVLTPVWAEYVYKYNIPRFERFAKKVWGVDGVDPTDTALKGINKMREFFRSIGMPNSLSEFGIDKSVCEKLANNCTYDKSRTIKSYIPLGYKEVKDIFELSF